MLTTKNGSLDTSFSLMLLRAEGENDSAKLDNTARKLLVMVIWRVSVEWIPISVSGGRFSGQMKPSASSRGKFGDKTPDPRS